MKQVLKTISDFNDLPETKEIKEIKQKYLNDEIGTLEFYSLAREYLDKVEDKS